MQTKTDVANLTLGMLGSTVTIQNINLDRGTVADILRRNFELAFQEVLTKHPWRFATKRAALILVSEDPTPEWGYEYALPNDAMVVRRIAQDNYFRFEELYEDQKTLFDIVNTETGYNLVTNVPNAYAEYTRKINTEGTYMNHFARAVAAQWAMDCAPAIITNNYVKVKDTFLKEARNVMSQQIAYDLSLAPDPTPAPSPFEACRSRT